MQMTMLAVVLITVAMVAMVRGHGMMLDPPQRSSMWRFGYPSSPKNYNDNQLFCGGFATQWRKNGGKCGICGDPYDAPEPRPNEAGGRYATGVIVKTYEQAQVIDVAVKITANHMGYFIFKLCPNNDVKKKATQECLDRHVLRVVGYNGQDLGTKFYIDNKVDTKHVRLQLPLDVTCTQCVLQWTYNTGNSWGCDKGPNRKCCVGCGDQENFVNCADVAISAPGFSGKLATDRPQVTARPQTARPATSAPATYAPAISGPQCYAVGVFTGNTAMNQWCMTNCRKNFCPQQYCTCK